MALLSNINDKFAVDSTGAIQFNGQVGTSGYVLKSNANAAPTWVDPSTVIGGPYLPLTGGTLTGALAGTSATFSGNVTISQPTNGAEAKLTLISKSAAGNSRTGIIEYDADVEKIFFINEGTTIAAMTSDGKVGIGTDSPNGKLDIQYDMDVDTGGITTLSSSTAQYGNINFSGVAAQTSGAAGTTMQGLTWQVNNYNGTTDYGVQAQLVVGNNGSVGTFMGFFTSANYGAAPNERLRIASGGNVGIGTTSPNYKLDVNGTTRATSSYHQNVNFTNTPVFQIGTDSYSSGFFVYDSTAAQYRMIVKSSTGNVGIGTNGPPSKLTVMESTLCTNSGSDGGTSYVPSKPILLVTTDGDGTPSSFYATNSVFTVGIGGGVTGGVTTEHLRVNLNGNVGIGTAGPAGKVQIVNNSQSTAALTVCNELNGGSGFVFQRWQYVESTSNFKLDLVQRVTSGVVQYAFDMVNNGVGYTSVLVLDRGKVGIGTTSPGAKLQVNGDILLTNLKATGNCVIGGTSINSSRLSVQDSKNGTANSPHFQILGNGYSAYHYLDTTAYNIVTNSTSREIRVIAQNGGVKLAYAATAWAANSDIALKENIKPLENVLDKIKDYKCVEYNLKESPEDKKIGFIAQDWVDDFPAIVNKDEKDMLGMKYTETIPVLLKAIQELKADNDSLKARIETLENK